MSVIKSFSELSPLFGQQCLSNFDIDVDNKMALDIFQYCKSKAIPQILMGQWFGQMYKQSELNVPALVTKLHRLKKEISKKRGAAKNELLSQLFDTSVKSKKDICEKAREVQESEDMFKTIASDIAVELSETRKYATTLKRKLVVQKKQNSIELKKLKLQHEEEIEATKEGVKELKLTKKKLKIQRKRDVASLKILRKYRKDSNKLLSLENKHDIEIQDLKTENINLKKEIEDLKVGHTQDMDTLIEEKDACINDLKAKLNDVNINCDFLCNLLQDDAEVNIFENNTYTTHFRQVVMNITYQNVINESLKLVDKRLNLVPTRKTIDNIVTEKVISQLHVGDKLKGKQNTTLYADETRKFGKTYNSYLASDDDKNIFC